MSEKVWNVYYLISGRATAQVAAHTEEEAIEKANKYEFIDGTEELEEWEYDEIQGVEEE